MCVELPCGYSSQTITKVIAYCKIAIYVCLILATAIFGLILESRNSELWKRHHEQVEASSSPNPGAVTKATVPAIDFNRSSSSSEEEFTFTTAETTSTTPVKVEDSPDIDDGNAIEPEELEHDLMHFMEMSHPVRACFILWIVLNFVSGLIFSIVLLQGARERNLVKVKIWFVVTIVSYLLWVPIYAYLACHAEEPLNVLVSGFMTYMLGGLCLWVVSGFIEELRIESISHRVGYKDMLMPFYKV